MVQNKCFYSIQNMKNTYFDSTQGKIKLFNFVIQLQVPDVPAAVTGFPTGIEFKPFEICHQTPLQIHW